MEINKNSEGAIVKIVFLKSNTIVSDLILELNNKLKKNCSSIVLYNYRHELKVIQKLLSREKAEAVQGSDKDAGITAITCNTLNELRSMYQANSYVFTVYLKAQLQSSTLDSMTSIEGIPYFMLMMLNPRYQDSEKGLLISWLEYSKNRTPMIDEAIKSHGEDHYKEHIKDSFSNIKKLWKKKKITREQVNSWTVHQYNAIEVLLESKSKNKGTDQTLMQNILSGDKKISSIVPTVKSLRDKHGRKVVGTVLLATLIVMLIIGVYLIPFVLLGIESTSLGAIRALNILGVILIYLPIIPFIVGPQAEHCVPRAFNIDGFFDSKRVLFSLGIIFCTIILILLICLVIFTVTFLCQTQDLKILILHDVDQIQTLEELDIYIYTKTANKASSSGKMTEMTSSLNSKESVSTLLDKNSKSPTTESLYPDLAEVM